MKRSIHFSICLCLLLTLYLSGRAQKPELVVQTGHFLMVHSVAFSPDGKTLASGSGDQTIRLWDAASGKELRTFHHNGVRSVAFSPDAKTLVSAGGNGKINFWDVSTGRELRTFSGHSDRVWSTAFSPDGKTLASGSEDKTIKLWDVTRGVELRTLAGHSEAVLSIAFSPDGKTLASGSVDKTIKLWDVATGRELFTLTGHSERAHSVAFSPDGNALASAAWDAKIKLWDVTKGVELRTLAGHTTSIYSVTFSPDGKSLASGGGNASGLDMTIRLWDVATGRELKRVAGHSYFITTVAFSPDGKRLASASADNTIKLWDVGSWEALRTLGRKEWGWRIIWSVAFSPDGKTLASASHDSKIKLWDIPAGRESHTLTGHSDIVRSVAFSPDGKTLASGSDDQTIKLWDVATGRELRTLSGHSDRVWSVTFSPDGTTLASGSYDHTIKLWDVRSGKESQTLSGHSNSVLAVRFTPDGQTLASASADKTIKLWDVSKGRELRTLSGHSDWVRSLTFNPSGHLLASGSDDKTIKFWDVSTGRELRTLSGHSDRVWSIAFSPDGKRLASGGDDRTIKLWDVRSGKESQTLSGLFYSVYSVAFSLDGKFLVSGSGSVINFWRVNRGELLASLIEYDKDDWVVVAPDGLFDGAPIAWDKIIWRFNNNTFNHAPVEAFFSDFYYPGLLSDIFSNKPPQAPSDISQKDRRQPKLELTVPTARNRRSTVRNVVVKIDVSEAPAGAQDVRLFRNDSLVKVWRGDVMKGQSSVTLETTIPIVAGKNTLTAYAFNRDNIKSSNDTIIIYGAGNLKRQGTAYILAVGVNSYSNPQYNLKYAVADARAFSAEFKLQQETLKNYGHVEVISLSDGEATKANILQRLMRLASIAQPEDAVIVYFAGHGTAYQNRFYLIPHDLGYSGPRTQLNEAGLGSILAHSVSDRELEQSFEKIDAGQILLVIDACNSGQALEAEEKRRGPMNSKGLAQLAYEKGLYILTAAQSFQAAKEAARLGHGYLTYALVVEGLSNGSADSAPKDGTVFIREWLDYATNRVPQMQLEKLQEERALGKDFSFVEGEARNLAPEKREVQRPRVFYRREIETNSLVVARPQAEPSRK